MRPGSVVQGERVYLGATAILALVTAMAWNDTVAGYGVALTAGVAAFTIGLFLLLILLATRRGSRAALIVLLILTAISVVSLLVQIATGGVALGVLGVLNALQVGLTLVGAVLLLRPAAREWFDAGHDDWEEDDA